MFTNPSWPWGNGSAWMAVVGPWWANGASARPWWAYAGAAKCPQAVVVNDGPYGP